MGTSFLPQQQRQYDAPNMPEAIWVVLCKKILFFQTGQLFDRNSYAIASKLLGSEHEILDPEWLGDSNQ